MTAVGTPPARLDPLARHSNMFTDGRDEALDLVERDRATSSLAAP